ncbi:MAG: hypothetical protein WBG08_05520, partial [Litorimonas sp.]
AYPWVGPAHAAHLPETLCRALPGEGLHMIRCRSGVEGVRLSAGQVVASRWWPAVPDAVEWNLFLQSLPDGSDLVSAPRPDPVAYPFRSDIPAVSVSPERLHALFGPGRLAVAAGALGAVAFAYFASAGVAASVKQSRLADEVAVLTPGTQEVLSLRRRTLAANRRLEAIRASAPLSRLPESLAELDAVLAEHGSTDEDPVRLRSISLDGARVEVLLDTRQPIDLIPFVTALEAQPFMENVSARSQGRTGVFVRYGVVTEGEVS